MKIKVKDHFYFGYKQGVKVYINGKKYPKKKWNNFRQQQDFYIK